MSMPFVMFTCDACDFKGSSMTVWGHFSYEDGARLLPLERTLAWCRECDDLVPMEVLPSVERIRDLENQVAAKSARVRDYVTAAKEQRGLLGRMLNRQPKLPDEIAELDYARASQERDLEDERARFAAMRGRTIGPRCLFCGAIECDALPNGYRLNGTWKHPGQPAAIGWRHVGCGGNFLAQHSGVQIAKRLSSRVYGSDGTLLRTEEEGHGNVQLTEAEETEAAAEIRDAMDSSHKPSP